MLDKETALQALREVYDPEIPINIVDLGLIYDVAIEAGNKIRVKMTLTAPGCPLAASISGEVKNRLEAIEGVQETTVEMVWDPPWSPERINKKALENLFRQRAEE